MDHTHFLLSTILLPIAHHRANNANVANVFQTPARVFLKKLKQLCCKVGGATSAWAAGLDGSVRWGRGQSEWGAEEKGGGVGVSESQSKHKEPKAAPVGCKYLHVPAGGVCLSALLLFCTETTIKRCDNKERLQPPLPLVVIESHCSTSHILTLQTGSGEEPRRTSENLGEPEH